VEKVRAREPSEPLSTRDDLSVSDEMAGESPLDLNSVGGGGAIAARGREPAGGSFATELSLGETGEGEPGTHVYQPSLF